MTVDHWATFWAIVIAIALAGFAILAFVVTIGGLRDVKVMLRRMGAGDDEKDAQSSWSEGAKTLADRDAV